jgi:uncharacterized membrane protein
MDFVVLRLIHIVSGAFWFGAAVTMFVFLQPTALATASDGQRFMLHLLINRRFSEVVLVTALLTGAAGAILFWRDTGLDPAAMTQPGSLGFTVGAVAGGSALLLFLFVGYPVGRRVIKIGTVLTGERRPATDAERMTLANSQRLLARVGATVVVLLTIALAAMATARYWPLVV